MKRWYAITNKADSPEAEVCIYDEIGIWGVRAKDFISELKSINKPLHIRINSPGGDVFDGLAIGNYLASYPHAVRATIDGMAASIASVIAASIKHVTIASNAFVMIHNPWTIAMGDEEEFKKASEFLGQIKESLITTYAKKCQKTRDTISKWMDETTWFSADEAKEAGLVDEVGDTAEVHNAFALDRLGIVPERVAKAVHGGTSRPAPQKDSMENLLKALAELGIIPSDKLTDAEATAAVKSWHTNNQTALNEYKAKVDAALKAEAEAAVAAKVTDEKQRPALVAAYLKDPESAKAFLATMPAPQAKKPGAEPIPIVGANGSDKPAITGINRLAAALKRSGVN